MAHVRFPCPEEGFDHTVSLSNRLSVQNTKMEMTSKIHEKAGLKFKRTVKEG